jgi:hypothetical protein
MLTQTCARLAALAAVLCLAVLGLAGLGVAGTPALAAGPAAAGWQVSYTLPVQNGQPDTVNAIAAISRRNAWAFGGQTVLVSGQALQTPAVFHWNGTQWSPVHLPGAAVRQGYFSAASASSASNVWAVSAPCAGCATFAMHCTGTKCSWEPGVVDASSVSAFGASDVWVASQAGLEQWNGRSWHAFAPQPFADVVSVSGRSADDIWATGHVAGAAQPEASLWNGTSWTLATLPVVQPVETDDQAIPVQAQAAAGTNVWLGGYVEWPGNTNPNTEEYYPWMLHLDGTKWSRVSVRPLASGAGVFSLASDGGGGVWALWGSAVPDGLWDLQSGLPFHYSHGQWTLAAFPAGSSVGSLGATPGLFNVPGTGQLWAPIQYGAVAGTQITAYGVIDLYTP